LGSCVHSLQHRNYGSGGSTGTGNSYGEEGSRRGLYRELGPRKLATGALNYKGVAAGLTLNYAPLAELTEERLLGNGDYVRTVAGRDGALTPTRNTRTHKARSAQKTRSDLSFARLIASYQERIYWLAMRITRNCEDAEDVQQETLLKVHRKQIQFEGRSQFTTWVCRIAINEALMCLRRRRGASHVPLEEALCLAEDTVAKEDFHSPIESPEAAYSRKELRDLLTRALENLRPVHRTVFLLRAVEQFSTRETAKALKISSSAVKVRLLRARSELRDYLKQAGANQSTEFPNGQSAV